MKKINLKETKTLLVNLTITLSVAVYCAPLTFASQHEIIKSAARLEAKADTKFIRGLYSDSFADYEVAVAQLHDNSEQKNALSYKLMNLYTLCQQDAKATKYYEYLLKSAPKDLSANDICNYADILRRNGEHNKAEAICLQYAQNNNYSKNQRFNNMMQSLSSEAGHIEVADNEVAIKRLSLNSDNSEYYIGSYKNTPYYIMSTSQIKCPNKTLRHLNKYMILDEDNQGVKMSIPSIPCFLQEGAITFNADNMSVIATTNRYNGINKIKKPEDSFKLYSTKLYISYYDPQKNRWSKFAPIFSTDDDYSYVHPVFVDNNTIIFSSNRLGSYGGMDIYTAHKNSNNSWSAPTNLGSTINTESDEISPTIHNNSLIFSSNGHAGNGGYDIYQVDINDNNVVLGSLYHYQLPINSAYNDYGLKHIKHNTYMISDRATAGTDDIYIINNKYAHKSTYNKECAILKNRDSIIGL